MYYHINSKSEIDCDNYLFFTDITKVFNSTTYLTNSYLFECIPNEFDPEFKITKKRDGCFMKHFIINNKYPLNNVNTIEFLFDNGSLGINFMVEWAFSKSNIDILRFFQERNITIPFEPKKSRITGKFFESKNVRMRYKHSGIFCKVRLTNKYQLIPREIDYENIDVHRYIIDNHEYFGTYLYAYFLYESWIGENKLSLYILQTIGIDVNLVLKDVIEVANITYIEMLVEYGAVINNDVIESSFKYLDVTLVKYLIENYAIDYDLDKLIVESKNIEILQYLLSLNNKTISEYWDKLVDKKRINSFKFMEFFINNGLPESYLCDKVVKRICNIGCLSVIKLVYDNYIGVRCLFDYDIILSFSVRNQDIDMVKICIENCIDPNRVIDYIIKYFVDSDKNSFDNVKFYLETLIYVLPHINFNDIDFNAKLVKIINKTIINTNEYDSYFIDMINNILDTIHICIDFNKFLINLVQINKSDTKFIENVIEKITNYGYKIDHNKIIMKALIHRNINTANYLFELYQNELDFHSEIIAAITNNDINNAKYLIELNSNYRSSILILNTVIIVDNMDMFQYLLSINDNLPNYQCYLDWAFVLSVINIPMNKYLVEHLSINYKHKRNETVYYSMELKIVPKIYTYMRAIGCTYPYSYKLSEFRKTVSYPIKKFLFSDKYIVDFLLE